MTEPIPSLVLATWSVADLDWLHDERGSGAEWRASGQRAEKLMAERRAARAAGERRTA